MWCGCVANVNVEGSTPFTRFSNDPVSRMRDAGSCLSVPRSACHVRSLPTKATTMRGFAFTILLLLLVAAVCVAWVQRRMEDLGIILALVLVYAAMAYVVFGAAYLVFVLLRGAIHGAAETRRDWRAWRAKRDQQRRGF